MGLCNAIERWYRTEGTSTKLGIIKHRDGPDVFVGLEFMGRWVDIHATGKYVDLDDLIPRRTRKPTNDESTVDHK